jgi:hypothetical protein
MKNLFALLLMSSLFMFTACDNDDDSVEVVDSSLPNGTLAVQRSGTFTAQNGTPTMGSAQVGTDDEGVTFLGFSDDFTTELGTGTVSIFLSTSDTFTPDPANGNPDLSLVGVVNGNGEAFYRLDGGVDSKYTHVILWCGTANIPFGNAPLQ